VTRSDRVFAPTDLPIQPTNVKGKAKVVEEQDDKTPLTPNEDIPVKGLLEKRDVSQRALHGRARARLTGALSKGGKMRGVATNVYLWKTSEKPKETGQKENSKFGSCIYA